MVLIPVWEAWDKIPEVQALSAVLFVAAGLYKSVHEICLKGRFRNKRLERIETERPLTLSEAVATLTSQLRNSNNQDWSEAQRKILIAVLDEVETLIADIEGVYTEVNLLVPHPTDDNMMRCIQRAKGRRHLPKDYPKKGMIAWRCMDEVRRIHEPNYTPIGKQKYRSILCFPLYILLPRQPGSESSDNSQEKLVFGVVSIDHENAYEFDGIEETIEEKVSPYLRLLEHIFVLQLALADGSRS